MRYLWDIADCLEEVGAFYKIMEDENITDSTLVEYYFLQLMKQLGKKPMGGTELNNEELYTELTNNDKGMLHITTDEEGKTAYKFIKKKGEE